MVITPQVKKQIAHSLGVTSHSRRCTNVAKLISAPGVSKWKIFYSDKLNYGKNIPGGIKLAGYDMVIYIGAQANALKQVRYQYLLLGK